MKPVIGFKEVVKPFSLIIKKEVQDKIDLICQKIHKDEWSGPIFYTQEGSLAENNLVITVQDLLLMHLGTAAYTEYSESPDIIAYMVEKDLLDCNMGLIHSHNNMETFFSGTDIATLKEEALQHNHFVSLIVNNRRTYSAAITTVLRSKKVAEVKENFSYVTFNGEKIEDVEDSVVETETVDVIWSKMKVISESIAEDQEVLDRIAELAKKQAALPIKTNYQSNTNNYPANVGFYAERGNVFDQEYNPLNKYQKDFTTQGSDKTATIPFTPPVKEVKKEVVKQTQGTEEFDPLLNSEIPYADIAFDDKLTELSAKKLVAGAILVPENNSINLSNIIKSMESMYSKVFTDIEGYRFFISGMVETIIFNIKDPSIMGFEESEEAAIAAFSIMSLLGEYESNIYLDVLIEELSNYLV